MRNTFNAVKSVEGVDTTQRSAEIKAEQKQYDDILAQVATIEQPQATGSEEALAEVVEHIQKHKLI